MKETFEQGWSARPFKEQFPELEAAEAKRLDEVNHAISSLYFEDMITESQWDTIRNKKFPKMVSTFVMNARRKNKGAEK